jgi:NADH dehydrogenase FAD-containing subunit
MTDAPRLLLLGGGHAHIEVLKSLAQRPIREWEVHLLTPHRWQIYSGMLPGWLAGDHDLAACTIDLDRLAHTAGVQRHTAMASLLDLVGCAVHCVDGSLHRFGQLSINIGSWGGQQPWPDHLDHVLHVRPSGRFVDRWPRLLSDLRACGASGHLIVVGGGAAGVELSLAIRRWFSRSSLPAPRMQLVGARAAPLHGFPRLARLHAQQALREAGIEWLGDCRVREVRAHDLVLHGGRQLRFDACLLCTGAASPPWLCGSGLAVDGSGFVHVNEHLRSVSHPQVWAAGDIAALPFDRPRSGVYALRAGAVLADNLRLASAGQPLRAWYPQRHALNLIRLGPDRAIGTWGPLSWTGTYPADLKDRIDARYIRGFGAPE